MASASWAQPPSIHSMPNSDISIGATSGRVSAALAATGHQTGNRLAGWGFGSRQVGDFFVSPIGAPTITLTLSTAGNMTILGALTQGSDRNSKADIEGVDPAEVLAKVAGLPIATWRYKDDQATHVGPMAQDFHAAFGLGADDKHIAPADMAGLGLAAIQALKAEVAEKEARIRALEQRLERLEAAQNP